VQNDKWMRASTYPPGQIPFKNEPPYKKWSGKGDLNPRPSPWQGDALPLSYSRIHTPDKERIDRSPTVVHRLQREGDSRSVPMNALPLSYSRIRNAEKEHVDDLLEKISFSDYSKRSQILSNHSHGHTEHPPA
jgi:hypothetical protein